MDAIDLKTKLEYDLVEHGIKDKDITFASIIVEEIVLLYKQEIDQIKYKINKNRKELYIELVIPGENKTPRQLEEDNEVYLLDNTLQKTNFVLRHEYKNESNIVVLSLERYFTIYSNMKFAFSYLRGDKTALILAWVFNIVAICANLVIPYFTGKLVTSYSENVFKQVILSASLLLVARIIYAIFIALAGIYYNKVSFNTFGCLQSELLRKLFSVTDEKLESYGSGQFIQRINADASEISNDVASCFNIASNAIYYIGVLVASLSYNKIVFFAELITFFGLYFFESKRIKHLERNRRKMMKINEEQSERIYELVSGATEIKIMNAKQYFIDKTSKFADYVAKLSSDTNIDNTKMSTINSIYIHTCFFGIMMYLGYALNNGTLTIPETLVLYNYFTIISMPLVSLVQRFLDFRKNFSIACERSLGLIEGNEFTKEVNGNIELHDVKGNIEFSNVSFTYDNGDNGKSIKVLNNISFKINAGTTVAIVGMSGSGKTTILKLIGSQRDPNIGTITIDGYDIMKLNKDSLRSNMSIISQTPYIFNTTIKENLLLAKPDATQKELEEVCEKACILDDILNTEHGFDTLMNEKGVRFSGGQKQRLAIARALLRKTKILILDEATSAVDNIAQEKIMKSIRNLSKDCTIIIVAHRLSTIVNSDNILFLSDGKIINQGNHKELLKTCPEYQQLYLLEEEK